MTGSLPLRVACSSVLLALAGGCSTHTDQVSHQEAPVVSEADRAQMIARLERKAEKFETRGPKRFDKPQEAMDFFMAQRLGEGMTEYPMTHLESTAAEIRDRAALQRGGNPGGISQWEPLGPGNIGGRTRGLAIDPVNPDVMYAGGVAGGVWKSTDAGGSWTPTGDTLINLAVTTIAIDPSNTNIIYAGTGEGFFNGDSVRGLGIFKSLDAGATWTRLGSTASSDFFYVNHIELNPDNPNRVFAATRSGVWRSSNGGSNFENVLANPFANGSSPSSNGSSAGATDLDIQPGSSPEVILAAFGSFTNDGLFRSADGGNTWNEVGTASDLNVFNQGRMTVEFAPSQPNVAYVAMADNGAGNETGRLVNIFRSTDGGVTWQARANTGAGFNGLLFSNVPFASGCFGSQFFSQGWYDNTLAVDPVDSDVIWVGGVDLFRSDNGGQSFGLASYWYFSPTDPNYVHADQHVLVFHPDYNGTTNQTLFSGSDGGIARTNNARASVSQNDCPTNGGSGPLPGVNWSQLNNGYAVTQFYHGDAATTIDRYVGGTQDNGTLRGNSRNDAQPWDRIIGGDGGYAAIDPTNPNVIYGETQNFPTIRKSTNGGASFSSATNGITDDDGLFITPFIMDQSNPDILWTGGNRPWRTVNAAGSWQLAGPDFNGPARLSAIGIAPSNSNVVYLGYEDGYVVRSTNALAASPTWTIQGNGNGLPAEQGFISWVAVDPNDPDTAYATSSTFGIAQIYKTTNGGTSWSAIDSISAANVPDIPVHCIAIRPSNPQQLYAGTELGVFASDNGGASWQPANAGLANTVVETLDFVNDTTLVAFTHGRSAFITEIPTQGVTFEEISPLPTVLEPGVETPISIDIIPTDDVLTGASIRYTAGAGDVEMEVPLVNIGGNTFSANLPAFECADTPVYRIVATADQSGTFSFPPSGSVDAFVGEITVILTDNAETDIGWSISGDATDGVWGRGFPQGNDRSDPAVDADGSGQAWLTEIDPNNSNSDVDGGTTILTSPAFDLAEGGEITFSYWFNNETNASADDFYIVELSADNGATWTQLRSYDPGNTWRTDTVSTDELAASAQTRIRFSVGDPDANPGVVEGGLDAVIVSTRSCTDVSICLADVNQDGDVNGLDFGAWLGAFNAGDPLADQNQDGEINGLDFGAWLGNFNAGCD